MSYRQIPANSTEQVIHITLPGGNVTYDDPTLGAWFVRPFEFPQFVTLIDHAHDAAHADGGWAAIGNQQYQFDVPDDAFVAGAPYVRIIVEHNGEIYITDVDLK